MLSSHFISTCIKLGRATAITKDVDLMITKLFLALKSEPLTIYQDGDYVFKCSWFSEVVSAIVLFSEITNNEIKDGARRTKTFLSIFHLSNIELNASTVETGSCYASVDNVSICKRGSCLGRTATFMVQAEL